MSWWMSWWILFLGWWKKIPVFRCANCIFRVLSPGKGSNGVWRFPPELTSNRVKGFYRIHCKVCFHKLVSQGTIKIKTAEVTHELG